MYKEIFILVNKRNIITHVSETEPKGTLPISVKAYGVPESMTIGDVELALSSRIHNKKIRRICWN